MIPALRGLAIIIAILGVVDPEATWSRPQPLAVDIVYVDLVGQAVGRQIASRLGDRAEVRMHELTAPDLIPCRNDAACVLVADGSTPVRFPGDRTTPISLVRIREVPVPFVSITSMAGAGSIHAIAAEGVMHVTLTGRGVAGQRSVVRLTDGGTVAGQTAHSWTKDGEVELVLRWLPRETGLRFLALSVLRGEGPELKVDDFTTFEIEVSDRRAPVLVYDTRPSWTTTFVRRALESDARFAVDFRTRLGSSIASGTAGAQLDEARLQRAEAVIVGAGEGLSDAEVDLLDAYVRRRGGSLILLPDRPIEGPLRRLVQGRWTLNLEAAPQTIGPLKASELWTRDALGPGDRALERWENRPVIVASTAGAGRIVVSGALDGWRYRSQSPGGTGFWQALIADAVDAAGPPLSVRLDRNHVAEAERGGLTVTRRSMRRGIALSVRGTMACSETAPVPLRFWPTGDPDIVHATLPATAGLIRCGIEVTDGAGGGAGLPFSNAFGFHQPRTVELDRLAARARATGGVVVPSSDDATLIGFLRSQPARDQAVPWHPLRSPWWIVPFAACLGVEWWDRRRRGLR